MVVFGIPAAVELHNIIQVQVPAGWDQFQVGRYQIISLDSTISTRSD